MSHFVMYNAPTRELRIAYEQMRYDENRAYGLAVATSLATGLITEIGVNFAEILSAVGVRDTTWWGRGLFIFFRCFRVPFTQIGYRYDFIHQTWLGLNIGEEYDAGPGAPNPSARATRRFP